MKKGLIAFITTLVSAGLAAPVFAVSTTTGSCSDAGYTTPVGDPASVLNDKRIITYDGESKEDHCSNGNLFKVGNPAKPVIDPRAYRGTWSAAPAVSGPGQVTYNYTVGGSHSYTFSLYRNDTGGLCWQDSAGNRVAEMKAKPGGLSGSCSP